MVEDYLLRDSRGYYWIWYRATPEDKPRLAGPHLEPMINPEVKPPIDVINPQDFIPAPAGEDGAK